MKGIDLKRALLVSKFYVPYQRGKGALFLVQILLEALLA